MPRRKELKSVAEGLLGSFISRNNDVDGYWGIGKLYLQAKQRDIAFVDVDLLARTIAPASPELDCLVSNYSQLLDRHCEVRGLRRSWVKAAQIHVEFDVDVEADRDSLPRKSGFGELFDCTVELTDDLGRVRSTLKRGRCWPHNPNRELRRLVGDCNRQP